MIAIGTNGWTGGQYSVVRACLGLYLGVHFAQLLPWGGEVFSSSGVLTRGNEGPLLGLFPNILALSDTPTTVTLLLSLGVGLSACLLLGWRDRAASVLLWYILACLFGRNPLTANPSLPFIGWMLLVHAALPRAPYGSLAAQGRTDPDGGWRFPPMLFGAAWILMGLAYSYSGFTKLLSPSWVDGTALRRVLENPLARPTALRELLLRLPDELLHVATWGGLTLELAFAPLALFRRITPWVWAAMLLMHLSLIVLVDFAELSFGMVLLHLFTFNPSWVRPRAASAPVTIFYDGTCALCHGFVRFVLAEDHAAAFRLSPLCGETFKAAVTDAQAATLHDSVVVRASDGVLLNRSAAVHAVLSRLGGLWRLASILLALVPRPIADAGYKVMAGCRRKLGTPRSACPILPPSLRERLLP